MYIIDRLEGDWAVIEGPENIMLNLPREILSKGARPGDVLSIIVRVDEAATKQRAGRSQKLLGGFFDE